MQILIGLLFVVVGFTTMSIGLFLFYALLPLLYAFFGAGVGYELGTLVTSTPPGEMSFVKMIFALVGGIAFAAAAYFLEPIRRILIGLGLGSLLGGLVATALGLTGLFGVIVMALSAAVGAGITVMMFDTFIIVASAIGGAGLALDGAHLVFRSLGIFDRAAIVDGAVMPLVLWIALAAVGMAWQFRNIERWTSNALNQPEPG